MKRTIITGLTLFTLTLAAPPISDARADFVTVSFEERSSPDGMRVFRFYAIFDDPTDQLLAISGNDRVPLRIVTSTGILNDGGKLAGTPFEDVPGAPITGPYDSWVALNAETFAGNDATFSPGLFGSDGTHAVIHGRHIVEERSVGGGWYDGDPSTPELPDASGRVLIAQIAVECSGGVLIEGRVNWSPGGSDGVVNVNPFQVATSEELVACIWDLDGVGGDGVVGADELIAAISNWGDCTECALNGCRAFDYDGDRDVDLGDILSLLSNWGPCDG